MKGFISLFNSHFLTYFFKNNNFFFTRGTSMTYKLAQNDLIHAMSVIDVMSRSKVRCKISDNEVNRDDF